MATHLSVRAELDLWQGKAACRGLDPQIFYPGDEDEAQTAVEVCGTCEVSRECLEWALSIREKNGVWGGATERDRRRIVRQRRRAARPSVAVS